MFLERQKRNPETGYCFDKFPQEGFFSCPHCGTRNNDAQGLVMMGRWEEGHKIIKCECCEKRIGVYWWVNFTFQAFPLKDDKFYNPDTKKFFVIFDDDHEPMYDEHGDTECVSYRL